MTTFYQNPLGTPINRMPCDQAVELLLRAAVPPPGKALRYQIKDGVLTLSAVERDKRNLPVDRRSVRYHQVPVGKALETLMSPYGFKVKMSSKVNWRVNLRAENTLVGDIYDSIVSQATEPVKCFVELPEQGGVSSPQIRVVKITTIPTTPITINAEEMPLRQVLERMFHEAHCDFEIEADMDKPITYSCTEKPLVEALKEIAAMASLSQPIAISSYDEVLVVKKTEP